MGRQVPWRRLHEISLHNSYYQLLYTVSFRHFVIALILLLLLIRLPHLENLASIWHLLPLFIKKYHWSTVKFKEYVITVKCLIKIKLLSHLLPSLPPSLPPPFLHPCHSFLCGLELIVQVRGLQVCVPQHLVYFLLILSG